MVSNSWSYHYFTPLNSWAAVEVNAYDGYFLWSPGGSFNKGRWELPEGLALATAVVTEREHTAVLALADWMQEHIADALREDGFQLADSYRERLRVSLAATASEGIL